MDHFYAHDFPLRGYKYAYDLTSPVLHIYGNAEVLEVFQECTAREMKAEVAPAIALHKIAPFETHRFGGYTVHTLAAQHSSREPLLFLIEKGNKRVLHLADTGAIPEESERFLASLGAAACDLVTLDCTLLFNKTEKASRHMGLDENMRTLEKLARIGLINGSTKKVITHFSHNSAPCEELLAKAEDEFGVIAAYDGMTIEI